LKIYTFNSSDSGGGAENVNFALHNYFKSKGHRSTMFVGKKQTESTDVLRIANDEYQSLWVKLTKKLRNNAKGILKSSFNFIGSPNHRAKIFGREPMYYPGSKYILKDNELPDIIHMGNLHGKYFDLKQLIYISKVVPTILRLSDMWMFTGHCAHSLDCERWEIGCGKCPDLNLYPAIKYDATKQNFNFKKKIYMKSRFYISTPSNWLMKKVKRSILRYAAVDYRVIPTGINTKYFIPGDKIKARKSINIGSKDKVVLAFKNGFLGYKWFLQSDFFESLSSKIPTHEKILFLIIGFEEYEINVNNIKIRYIKNIKDKSTLRKYYQSSDLYLHLSKAENYSNTIMEAQSCGLPTLAYEIGGNPEQVIPFNSSSKFYQKISKPTGALVNISDKNELVQLLTYLLDNNEKRDELSINAINHASLNFNFENFADSYLRWYSQILS